MAYFDQIDLINDIFDPPPIHVERLILYKCNAYLVTTTVNSIMKYLIKLTQFISEATMIPSTFVLKNGNICLDLS